MRLIVLSGPIGVGKTSFGNALIDLFGATRVSTHSWLLAKTGCQNERSALQVAGDRMDAETGAAWVADAVEDATQAEDGSLLLLDSARIEGQVQALRGRFLDAVFHVHLNAEPAELEHRYLKRKSELKEHATYAEARSHGTEAQVGSLAAIADLVLETDHSGAESLASTAMAIVGRTITEPERLVDVVVGGQYGSEGKGNICANIAKRYGALMRIGGPNAGHRVFDPCYKYIQLPSGTGSNPEAIILIGAGSTLWLPQLIKEIADHSLTDHRLMIDGQAMVIDDWDRRAESDALASIASTKQGVGAASARKIVNRGERPMLGPTVTLARDVPQLAEYVGDVRERLDRLYRSGTRVLLEGTQGTALSIHHGLYPSVTSRETSASGCMADAGISHRRVKRVIMVVRTYPIRVGGTSGWMGRELGWQEIANRSSITLDKLKEAEKGTVSGNLRRVAEFDWAQLRRAAELNGATEVALTFADYLGIDNRQATSFSELNDRTQEFIRRVERVAGVPVTMVSKDFAVDAVIERGTWN